ncbi:MAG TPA: hypothetical protein VIK89_15230 [Cytophagaceae bacterium]
MRRKVAWIMILVGFLTSNNCFSQIRLQGIVGFDYSYGIASGGLRDFIPKEDFDGVHFQWRYFIKRNVSLGFCTGFNNFDKELPRAVYETNRGTVSAIQTRYFHTLPLLITGYYYWRSLQYVMPYAGLAGGGYLVRYEKYFGAFPLKDSGFTFGFRPEVGVVLPFKNSGLGVYVNGKFNKVFYAHEEVDGLRFFEVGVGLYFGYPVFDDSFLREKTTRQLIED